MSYRESFTPTFNSDAGIVDAVTEIVNEETYGWTDEQHEQEIERLKQVVESIYREQWRYTVERYGPDEDDI